MTQPTSQPLDLDAIEARAAAATPGPWCTDSWEIYQDSEYQPGISFWIGETCRADEENDGRADAEFVAHARTDVPAMAAEIRRLRAELAAVTALCDEQDMAARMFELPTPEWVTAVRRAAAAPAAARP
jgi:hypothetical protein